MFSFYICLLERGNNKNSLRKEKTMITFSFENPCLIDPSGCPIPLPRIPDMIIEKKALINAKGKASKRIVLPDGTIITITITVEEANLNPLANGESLSAYFFLDSRDEGSTIEIKRVLKNGKDENLKNKGWNFS